MRIPILQFQRKNTSSEGNKLLKLRQIIREEILKELHFKSDHKTAQIISGGRVVFEIKKAKDDYKINILSDIETWSRSKFKAYIEALKDLL